MSMLALKLAMAAAGSAGGAAWEGLNSLYFKWNNNVKMFAVSYFLI